jgi:hypothetical protein
MRKAFVLSLFMSFFFDVSAFSDTTLSFYIDKLSGDSYDVIVTIHTDTWVSVKGPAMANYEAASLSYEFWEKTWRSGPKTFNEMKTFIAGTWYVNVNYLYNPSIYSFTIADTLQESDFLPLPSILQPQEGADDIISQDCLVTWDPNGADTNAELLWIWGWWLFDSPPVSATSETLGWLSLEETWCRVGYLKSAPSGFMGPLQYVSGPTTSWAASYSRLISSDQHTFTVSRTLDLNDDWFINFYDYALYCSQSESQIDWEYISAFCRHWLESGPSS